MSQLLDEMLARVKALPPEQFEQLQREVAEATGVIPWAPNPGPQLDAFLCPADEVFFGGQAGGAKTDLLLGLAITEHQRSLVLRRTAKEAVGLVERTEQILGTRDGWNGQQHIWRLPGRNLELDGCEQEHDKQKFKGRPHDFYGFDEIGDFLESQYTFIIGWNRSEDPRQRCRVVAAGNPPTRPEGLWILKRWAPWLDPHHARPAVEGELRWYTTGEDGRELEVDGPGPHKISGQMVLARSRTFIRSKLSDNPDLSATNYDSVLAAMPEEYRQAYREGKFDAALRDDLAQVIPSAWVAAAQARWQPDGWKGRFMNAIGVDCAQGGAADTVLAPRYGVWFAEPIIIPGTRTPLGSDIAGAIIAHRRNNCTVIIDMGGGYGSSAYEHLSSNVDDDTLIAYKGAAKSMKRDKSGKLGFSNKRSEGYWKMREGLDPSQPGGSSWALPPGARVMAELTAPRYKPNTGMIELEAKEKLIARLGYSPDVGDAIMMSTMGGPISMPPQGTALAEMGGFGQYAVGHEPKVIQGHQQVRDFLRRGR